MDRREIILEGLRLDGVGLEIGPSYGPIAAGAPGLQVRTLDHLDQAGLVEKYGALGVDTSRIQPVDYVWSGQRYADLVGADRFDWIVASHVIEHVPDLVGFVEQCAEILVDDGILSLVVPDKRFVFDFYRPATSLSSLVDASLRAAQAPSPGRAADFVLNFARLNGLDIWPKNEAGQPRLENDASAARDLLERVAGGEYADIHNWVFTPNSFRLAILDLGQLGLIGMSEVRYRGSDTGEFYVQLSKAGGGRKIDRQALAAAALEDLREGDGEAELRALRQEADQLRAALADVERSSSWRITAPLRAFRRRVQQLRRG